jgi:hypothetical protein
MQLTKYSSREKSPVASGSQIYCYNTGACTEVVKCNDKKPEHFLRDL